MEDDSHDTGTVSTLRSPAAGRHHAAAHLRARYQRMIAESREREFALCMLDPASPTRCATCTPSPPGCGSSISICCPMVCSASRCSGWSGCVSRISGRKRTVCGSARWIPLPPWQSGRLQADQHSLAKALQDVFSDYPEYAALYPEPDWEDAAGSPSAGWRCCPSRWSKTVAGGGQDNQPTLSLLSGLLVASH